MKIIKKYAQEPWYTESRAARDPNTSPDILRIILKKEGNDFIQQNAARNPNCPPDALRMVLERGNYNEVSRHAARNSNCPIDILKTILERGKDDWVSRYAALNLNCPIELLKMVLERGNNDLVSAYAAENPNCPPLEKIKWMRTTGKIGNYDPSNPKHFIEYNEPKVDKGLQELREIRKKLSKTNNWYKIAQENSFPHTLNSDQMTEFVLNNQLKDWSGPIDYQNANYIAKHAEPWILTNISLDSFTWSANPEYKNDSQDFPPIVLSIDGKYEVLDGKHRIGMAKARGLKSLQVYLGKI